jgi:NitT/TauT family transport system substrate-binding protein
VNRDLAAPPGVSQDVGRPHRRRRPVQSTVAAALGLVLLAACSSEPAEDAAEGTAATSSEDAVRPVVLGANPITDLAPLWVADEQGMFAEHGMDVRIETGAGGAALIPGVVSGQSQFTFVNPTTLYVALEQGLDLVVVSGLTSSTNEVGADAGALIVPADSPIQSARDLEGSTIAINTLNSIVSTVTRQSIRKAGGDPDAVQWAEIPFGDMPAQLASGNVDAMFSVEPFLSTSLGSGMRAIAWPYVDTAPDVPIALAITSRQLAEEDPELVADFTAALEDAVEYATDNPDEARRIASTYTQLSPEELAMINLPAWSTEINRAAAETLAELAVMDGIISEAPDLDRILPDE